MPRKSEYMAKIGKKTQFKSGEKAAKSGKKGGIKSGEAKRQKKIEDRNFREEIIKKMGAKDWDEVVQGVIQRAKESNQGFEILRDTLGQMPQKDISVNVDLPQFLNDLDE